MARSLNLKDLTSETAPGFIEKCEALIPPEGSESVSLGSLTVFFDQVRREVQLVLQEAEELSLGTNLHGVHKINVIVGHDGLKKLDALRFSHPLKRIPLKRFTREYQNGDAKTDWRTSLDDILGPDYDPKNRRTFRDIDGDQEAMERALLHVLRKRLQALGIFSPKRSKNGSGRNGHHKTP